MEHQPRMIVAVRPASALHERPRLFTALQAAFPVDFRAWSRGAAGADAVIEIADAGASASSPAPDGPPAFVVFGDTAAAGPEERVQVLDRAAVDPRVRCITLTDRLVGPSPAVSEEHDEVLATGPSGPVWVSSPRGRSIHRVRAVLPELGPDQVLYTLLSRRPIAAVALIHFLRAVCEKVAWSVAPLRAAFVFDDPNLRWRSYGFIDYERLLEHADLHGYHAAMAMVPLDASREHGPTVALFKSRPDRLSLVVHGNDHTKRELLRPRPPLSALAMAAQALRRIERFERRCGLPVDRVMTPPHGMCSEDVARALAAVGFEALCAIHPLPWDERPPGSPLLAGWRPAEYVGGCAVVSRMPLTATIADIALQALLNHPIVMYGHHDDLAEGLDPLAEAAGRVNRLGAVKWMSVGEIARSNYALRVDDGRAVVRPYARRISITVPAQARTLSIQAPADPYGALELRGWTIDEDDVVRPFGTDAPTGGSSAADVRLIGTRAVDPSEVPAPSWRPWPAVRRAGAEMRDRALPLRPARAR